MISVSIIYLLYKHYIHLNTFQNSVAALKSTLFSILNMFYQIYFFDFRNHEMIEELWKVDKRTFHTFWKRSFSTIRVSSSDRQSAISPAIFKQCLERRRKTVLWCHRLGPQISIILISKSFNVLLLIVHIHLWRSLNIVHFYDSHINKNQG